MTQGQIHVYTGDGKGKTTASIGLAMRAAGHGWKVLMVQFMKGRLYGELSSSKNVPGFDIEQYGRDEFVDKKNPEAIDLELAAKGLARAAEAVKSDAYDMVILDEINVALDFGLVKLDDVMQIIQSKPERLEIVCTGRYAPAGLVEAARLVTEMKEIRHPFQKDIAMRRGIEY